MTLIRDTSRAASSRLLQHLAQHAVDAEAHHQAFLEGFQVDVRGVLADRLAEDRVDQANDRRVVLLLHQVLGFRDLVGQRGEVQAAAEVLGERMAAEESCW